MLKKTSIIFFLLLNSILFAAGGWYCVGSMRIKIILQNNEPIYGYTTIHGYDLELLNTIGIDSPNKMYKLEPMTDILPFLSNKVENRKVALEIFDIPHKLSVVPENKLIELKSIKGITKIEYIDWMGLRGCECSSFVTLPEKDIKRLRKSDQIYVKIMTHGEFLANTYYINTNKDKDLNIWIFDLLVHYSYWEVIFNKIDSIGKTKSEKFYSHFQVMYDLKKYHNLLKEVHVFEYFQYIQNYIDSFSNESTNEENEFIFDKNELKRLYDNAIEYNNIIILWKATD